MNKKVMIIIMKGTSLRRMEPDLRSLNSCLFATIMEVIEDSRSVIVKAGI
jgi:hypothetical protein